MEGGKHSDGDHQDAHEVSPRMPDISTVLRTVDTMKNCPTQNAGTCWRNAVMERNNQRR